MRARKAWPGLLAAMVAVAGVNRSADAVEEPMALQFGRYMPLYPGLYATVSIATDERDRVYDADGNERDTATPIAAGNTAFPRTEGSVAFQWYFPMWESDQMPFFSKRLHTARVTLRAADSDTEGALNGFIRANGLESGSTGVGDLSLEFGSFLLGSENWRSRERTPLSVLALLGVTIPVGSYDVDAPTNAGSNEFAWSASLGMHLQLLERVYFDSGLGWRTYSKNHEPAFGANEPAQLGDLFEADASLGWRIRNGVYLSGGLQYQDGGNNKYENPRFSMNPPPPAPLMENLPTRGIYRDDGTRLLTGGVSLDWFLLQDWLLGVHAMLPLDGESGEFVLPYSSQLAGCRILNNCAPAASGQSDGVDGLGKARSYASNLYMVTLTWSFGRGDPWQ